MHNAHLRHILITFSVKGEAERAMPLIAKVPGVARCSCAFHTNREPAEYCRAAIDALAEFGPFETFKVAARRSNTDYQLTNMDLNQQVGEALCLAYPEKKVKMREPDATVHVLVVQGSVYVYAKSMRGVGGLPQGSAGKVVTLLSSGIDSPVATLASPAAARSWCRFISRAGRAERPTRASTCVRTSSSSSPPRFRSGACTSSLGDCQREISLKTPST